MNILFQYMAVAKAVPLQRATIARVRATKPAWSKAVRLLQQELGHLGAQQIVLEAGYRPHQIRADGWPRGSVTPEHGQVRVTFDTKDGQTLSFAQTGWLSFEYNLYTIGMLMKYLRDADVFRCGRGNEQYRGYAQLPPGRSSQTSEWANREDAASWLRKLAGVSDQSAPVKQVYRLAAMKAHPDTGGSDELMFRVNRAMAMVGDDE